MDHAVDLEADLVINEHLRNIESLILDPSPKGFGLSSRYCFAYHHDMLFLVLYEKNKILKLNISFLLLWIRFDKEMIRHCYGVLRVNSFAVETVSGGSGRALFPVTALISHSCQPNVLHDPKASSTTTFEEKQDGNIKNPKYIYVLRYEFFIENIYHIQIILFFNKLEISLGSANGVFDGELDADSNIRR